MAVIDDDTHLEAAVVALVDGGFAETEVIILSGVAGVAAIDAKGERKGLLARLFRIVDGFGDEHEHTARHVEALEAGGFVVVVVAPDDDAKHRAHTVLAANGGHFINYYGRLHSENLAR